MDIADPRRLLTWIVMSKFFNECLSLRMDFSLAFNILVSILDIFFHGHIIYTSDI